MTMKGAGIALIGYLAAATFLLWEEHQAHILGILPWAILLLCPILHLFMHRGHGGHGGHVSHEGHEGHRGGGGATHESHDVDKGRGGGI